MKSLILMTIIIVTCSNVDSQILSKGDIDISLGVGFGIYTFTTNDYEDNSSAAVPGLLNVSAAYQISDKFALGIAFERNGFVTDADSNVKATSLNFGITAGYNIINSEKNVLQPFLVVGSSNFRFENFNNQDYVKSNGTQVQLGLSWKHFFGETVGMFLNFSIPYYSYNQFVNSNGDTYEVSRLVTKNGAPVIESRVLQGVMSGVNFRTGINLRF